jgi:beta-N-acetylhexosaminidase
MLRYLLLRPVVVLCAWWCALAPALAQPDAALPPLTTANIVLLRNEGALLPLQHLDTLRLATITMPPATGREAIEYSAHLQQDVADYAAADFVSGLPASAAARLRSRNLLLLVLPDGGPQDRIALHQALRLRKKLVVLLFDSTALARLPELPQATAVVLARQRTAQACSQAIQVIFGGVGAVGQLAENLAVPAGLTAGLPTRGGLRLAYAPPAVAGLRPTLPALVDSLMRKALDGGAFPGGEVMIVRHGVVALRRSYGVMQAAGPAAPVLNTTLYDFASLTKVTAALPALMLLQDRGLFGPDYTLGALFDFLKGSNKQDLRLRDVLTHQARLRAFIPFWQQYVNPDGHPNPQFLRPDSSALFPLPVAAGLWARRDMPALLYQGIAASPLNAKPGYVYSDLSFMLYPYYVQKATGRPFDQFITQQLYAPLGATTLGFNPEHRFPSWRIAPTEYDSVFRHQLVRGTVHDEGAALLGGVSGHAGLFGAANDLAKLVQLYLWQGRYGGQQLIKAETMAAYTSCPFCPDNRRALGFDKPDPKNPALNAARGASPRSYGHTGFTGTYFWVEPDLDLFVILLTNRVNPTRRNNRLGELGVRSALLQLAIESAQP